MDKLPPLASEGSPEQVSKSRDPLFRMVIPTNTPTVGRSVKLRNLFSLSGTVAVSSTPVTVTASTVSTTETDLASFRFFKNEFHVGMVIRITALGTYTSDGTRTVTIRLGQGTAPVTEWNSMVSTAASTTNNQWNLTWHGIITAIGSSGTLEAQMVGCINNVLKNDPNSATVAFDTTLDRTIGLTATWSANNISNSITLRQFIVEILH